MVYHCILTINMLRDDRPVKSETCRSLMCLEYYCEPNENCVHLLVKTVDITALVTSLWSVKCIAHRLPEDGTSVQM